MSDASEHRSTTRCAGIILLLLLAAAALVPAAQAQPRRGGGPCTGPSALVLQPFAITPEGAFYSYRASVHNAGSRTRSFSYTLR